MVVENCLKEKLLRNMLNNFNFTKCEFISYYSWCLNGVTLYCHFSIHGMILKAKLSIFSFFHGIHLLINEIRAALVTAEYLSL